MASLAEDPSWYDQFERAAEGHQPSLDPHIVTSANTGILGEILRPFLQLCRVTSPARTESLPLAERGANRKFELTLLEWSRSKMDPLS